jgi:uncharacterized membrane protein YfcA
MPPLDVLATGAVAVFFGYGMFGITAFGAAILIVPILTHVMPLSEVLPVTVVFDVGAATTLAIRGRRDAERRELLVLTPFSILGAVLGVTLLVSLPRAATLGALGVFLLFYAVWSLAEGGRLRRISAGWAPVSGLVGGIMGTLFGAGGPGYVIYLSRRIEDKARLRATIAAMVALGVVIRLGVFASAGLMTRERFVMIAWWLPFAAIGFLCGSRLQPVVPRDLVVRLLNALLLVLGASLLWRAVSG